MYVSNLDIYTRDVKDGGLQVGALVLQGGGHALVQELGGGGEAGVQLTPLRGRLLVQGAGAALTTPAGHTHTHIGFSWIWSLVL